MQLLWEPCPSAWYTQMTLKVRFSSGPFPLTDWLSVWLQFTTESKKGVLHSDLWFFTPHWHSCSQVLGHIAEVLNVILTLCHFLQVKYTYDVPLRQMSWYRYNFTSSHQVVCKIRIQFLAAYLTKGAQFIILKIKMPSLNQVTMKLCIWENYNYHVVVTLPPNKVKSKRQIFKLKNIVLSWK
jgi:hypothetical protein